MRQIVWRGRVVAAAVHFGVTLFFAAIAAGIIFLLWFPGQLSGMVGGTALFGLVIGCDLILGPLLSLVIFDRKKPRKELVLDYTIIGIIQLAALIYGVSVVADSRPLFIAFTRDRFEIVTAIELSGADLADASKAGFRADIWSGPKLVAVRRAENSGERHEMLFSGLAGKDVQLLPKYYQPYTESVDEVKQKGLPISDLFERHSDVAIAVTDGFKKLKSKPEQLRWLPVHHRFGFGVVFIDMATGYPVDYLPIDPY